MRWAPSYHKALHIQERLLNAMGLDKDGKLLPNPPPIPPNQLASLAAAWDKLEDRKRILRDKPLPKAREVPRWKDGKQRKVVVSE